MAQPLHEQINHSWGRPCNSFSCDSCPLIRYLRFNDSSVPYSSVTYSEMSVGFGFSAGDFLAALKLTGTVIDCLCESSASSASYRELLNELYALESALLRVKRLDLDEDQKVEKIALRQAAAQCQRTIDDFWGTIQKYHPNLQEGGSSSRLRDGWVKVKWVLLKKEDLEKFKRDIAAHTNSITILLLTTQFEATNMQGRRAENQQITLAGRIQDASNQCMNRLASLVSSMNENVKQGKKLLETTASVVQTNLRVFQMVFDIHQFILQIPHQVHRQQPVYMIDAFGKESPFHLEFVRSAEALVSILRCNFSVVPSGQRLIESGNFVIQDCGTQRDIDLSSSWELCFSPGQRVMMSVILTNNGESCPNCSARLLLQGTQEQTCQRCGTTLMLKDREPLKTQLSELWEPRLPSSFEFTLGRAPDSNRLKRKRESSEILDTSKFRRIRMMNPRFKTHRCKVYKHENNDWLDQGTGRATVQLYNNKRWLKVESEDSPGQFILSEEWPINAWEHCSTILRWEQLHTRDKMALSFETEEGHEQIWKTARLLRHICYNHSFLNIPATSYHVIYGRQEE